MSSENDISGNKIIDEENDINLLNTMTKGLENTDTISSNNASNETDRTLLNNKIKNADNKSFTIPSRKQTDETILKEKIATVDNDSEEGCTSALLSLNDQHSNDSVNVGDTSQKSKLSNKNDIDSDSGSENITLNKQKHSRRLILDDDLNVTSHEAQEKQNQSYSMNAENKKKYTRRRLAIVDSDSEEETIPQLNSENIQEIETIKEIGKSINEESSDNIVSHKLERDQVPSTNTQKKEMHVRRRLAIVDSDSEEEQTNSKVDFKNEQNTDVKKGNASLIHSDDYFTPSVNRSINEDLEKDDDVDYELHLKRVVALCDSEDSGEENIPQAEPAQISKVPPKKKNTKKSTDDEPFGKKMTHKQALKQRQEIRSESQRMLRESRVSLPYHKPKSHSIKEFLQRRPKLALSILNTNDNNKLLKPSVAIKMTAQQLEVVTKKLEEREKEVQEFYKSESESDNDDFNNEGTTPPSTPKQAEENNEMEIGEEQDTVRSEGAREVSTKETNQIDDANMETAEEIGNNEISESTDKIVQETSTNVEATAEQTDDGITECIKEKSAVEAIQKNTTEELHNINVTESVNNKSADQTSQDETVNIEATKEPIKKTVQEDINSGMSINFQTEVNTEKDNNICDETKNIQKEAICVTTNSLLEKVDANSNNFLDISTESVTEPNEVNVQQLKNCSPCEEIEIEADDLTMNENAVKEPMQQPSLDSDSMDFDFSIVEDELIQDELVQEQNGNYNSSKEKGVEDKYLENLLKKYSSADDPDNLSVSDQNGTDMKLNKQALLKQLETVKPRLSGGPEQEIDLDEGTTKPSEVSQLMKRFMKHALPKHVVKNKVQLNIINLSQGEVHKETVAMSVDAEEEPPALEKPGVRLQKLRNKLQSQMAQRRSEMWQQKLQPLHGNKDENMEKGDDDEKSECGADENILDDEEEAELTDGETSDDYDDECINEDEEEMIEKKTKSAFVDDEAEESEADECNNEQDDENDDIDEQNEESEEDENNSEPTCETKKPLRRIIKGFTEDSDDDGDDSITQAPPQKVDNKIGEQTKWNEDDEDEMLPPNQPSVDKTPHKQATQKSEDLSFLTPVQHLTGLQGFNSGSKFLQEESLVSPILSLPADPSPLRETNWNSNINTNNIQKNLFSNSCDFLDSQTNMEEIAELCSGKFSSPTQSSSQTLQTDDCAGLRTQDVLSICSGSFPDITQEKSETQPHNDKREEVNDIESNVQIKKSITQKEFVPEASSNDEIQDLDDDKLISQLLDEEELELFKKKFESPIAATTHLNTEIDEDQVNEVIGGGKLVSDSSEDEGDDDTKANEKKNKKKKKKLQKRLAFSDDESEAESEDEISEYDEEEAIDLHDDCDTEDEETKVVDYDSEENEIEIDENEEIQHPQKKLRSKDFLEHEAELSESDWGSEDEDEKGLDNLEIEQGDADVFDENKMRSDLEKIHMRRVLDDDNREIKILQEMLLEDGELHGTGRQRQFKWKNVDDNLNNEDGPRTEIDAYLDDEESEEQWRRARHQREMFLKSKQEKREIVNDDFLENDSNSQVLKLGQEVVRRSLSNTTVTAEKTKLTTSTTTTTEITKPLMLMNTRGSFLARNDKFLTRLAQISNTTTTVMKNSKKIVFQTIDVNTDDANDSSLFTAISNKRKAGNDDGTPKMIKKLRLSSNLTPDDKSENRKKQLFK